MKKILVIDDEEKNRKLIKEALESTGFIVIDAEDGIEGIYIAKKEMPDLILLDLAMPEIDGIEACKRLKEMEATKDIPVIMLSAMNDKQLIDLALASGAEGYLIKPLKHTELMLKLNELGK